MDIVHNKELKQNSYTILRQAGYIPIRDRQSGKDSYVLKIHGAHYPRFHLYVEQEGKTQTKWHMHFDKKEHGWSERRHDTDYDSREVKDEAARLLRWLGHYSI